MVVSQSHRNHEIIRKRDRGLAACGDFLGVACDTAEPLPDDVFVNVPGGRIAFRVIGEGNGESRFSRP